MKSRWALAIVPFLVAACDGSAEKPKAPQAKAAVQLTLLPQDTLAVGKSSTVLAKLSHVQERVVLTEADLNTVHTKKFHLLVIDPTLTDYQHIHPQPTDTPGVFSFNFTPKFARPYRAWADVTLRTTGKQEYAYDDMGGKPVPAIVKTESREATVDGYHFALSFDTAPVAGGESMGSIRVTDAGGKPVSNLQPVMGAFAHIVGFYDDFRTVVHTHPMGKEPEHASDRGGPELMFHLSPGKPGFVKLFAQVNIGGKDIFAPFGVMVGK